MIWGANPVATNIHLIPFIIYAKMKGEKVVVDPIYTQLADLYIQLHPGTDGTLPTLANNSLCNLINCFSHFVISPFLLNKERLKIKNKP